MSINFISHNHDAFHFLEINATAAEQKEYELFDQQTYITLQPSIYDKPNETRLFTLWSWGRLKRHRSRRELPAETQHLPVHSLHCCFQSPRHQSMSIQPTMAQALERATKHKANSKRKQDLDEHVLDLIVVDMQPLRVQTTRHCFKFTL